MTNPRIDEVVRRLQANNCYWGTGCGTKNLEGSGLLCSTCEDCEFDLERAVRAGLELAAEYLDEQTETDYPWRFARSIRTLASTEPGKEEP